MRIIFVRHGHPNYEKDCLTELGHLQAEAAAQRLACENIEKIYSSTQGRAVQTAEHIANKAGLDIEQLDFMREIAWGSVDDDLIPHNGHPWFTADDMVTNGESILNPDWASIPYFCRNKVVESVKKIDKAFDCWLSSLGYEREGKFYRVGKSTYDTVVLASHGGSSSAVLAHIFNLPFSFVIGTLRPDFTGITVIDFSGEEGTLISPRIEVLNDAAHIKELSTDNVYGK